MVPIGAIPSAGPLAQFPALYFGSPAPDPRQARVGQGKAEALGANGTVLADGQGRQD